MQAHESLVRLVSNQYLIIQTMNKNKKQFLVFLAVFMFTTFSWLYTQPLDAPPTTRLLTSYLTSSSRSNTLSQACGSETRQTITQTKLSNHVSSVNTSVGIDGTEVIRLAAKVSYSSARTKVLDNSGGYIQFILTFGVGLIVLLLSFPFMICCCTCNSCCPPKCCGRKPQGHKFENYNILCPLFKIIVLIIMAVAVSIYGLIVVRQDGKQYKRSSCAAAILTDDILNGNVTSSGNNIFLGLNNFPIYFGYLQGNLSSIDGNLSDIHSSSSSTTMNQAISKSQNALTDTIKISNNDANGTNLTLTYNTPIDTTTTSSSISSTFSTVLGSYSSQTGLVWSLYSAINPFNQFLTKFKANASNLHANISAFSQGLSQAVTSANNLKNDVNSKLNDANNFIEGWSNHSKNYEPAMFGFLIGSIGIMILCLIAAICAYRGKTHCCRRFMYLNCFIMFFICLIGFVLATFSSAALPIYAWSCNYLDESISSQYNYQNNLNPWISIKTLQQTGVCMPYGNGDIYTQLAGTAGAEQFDVLRGVFTTLTTFQLSPYIDPIYTSLTTTLTTIQSYGLGQIIDINDQTSLSILSVLANYSKGSYTNCNSNALVDSWVPSNRPSPTFSTIISCTATNGNQGTASTCPSGLSSTSGGCSGCMDSSELFFRYLNPIYSLPIDLSLRYGSTCSFNTKLNNVWTNYYKIKLTAIGPTVGSTSSSVGVYPRAKTVQTDVNSLNTTVSPVLPNTISTINNNLASISSLTNPTYGIFGSVNCKVMGQDAQRIRGTLCGTAFTHTYIMRIILGTISYILLLALFFIVVFGSRHARQAYEEQQNPTYYPHDGINPYQTNDDKNKPTPVTSWNNHGQSAGNIAYL